MNKSCTHKLAKTQEMGKEDRERERSERKKTHAMRIVESIRHPNSEKKEKTAPIIITFIIDSRLDSEMKQAKEPQPKNAAM